MKKSLKYLIFFLSFLLFIFIFIATYSFYRLVNDGISLDPLKKNFIQVVNSNLSLKLVNSKDMSLKYSEEKGIFLEIGELKLDFETTSSRVTCIDSLLDFSIVDIIFSRSKLDFQTNIITERNKKYLISGKLINDDAIKKVILNEFKGEDIYLVKKTSLILTDSFQIKIQDEIEFKAKINSLIDEANRYLNLKLPESLNVFQSWTNIVIRNEIDFNRGILQEDLQIQISGIVDFRNTITNLKEPLDVAALDVDIFFTEENNLIYFKFFNNGEFDLRDSQITFSKNFDDAYFDIKINTSNKASKYLDMLSVRKENEAFYSFKELLIQNPVYLSDAIFKFRTSDLLSTSSYSVHDISVNLNADIVSNFIEESDFNPTTLLGNSKIKLFISLDDLSLDNFTASGILNLNETDLFLKPFNFKKEKGDALEIGFEAEMSDNLSVYISNKASESIDIKGNIVINKNKEISINKLKINNFKNLNLSLSGDIKARKINANINGELIDLSALKIERKKKNNFFFDQQDFKFDVKNAILEGLVNVRNMNFEINQEREKLNVKGKAESNGHTLYYNRKKDENNDQTMIKSTDIISFIGDNHPFKKILSRADVTISSSRESYSTKSINDIKLKEFTLINSPASLKLLTLPSLSGISGLIENEEGINFLKGEVKYIEDTDYFTDIEMYGVSDSIGLVMDGSINRRDRTLDFVGEISPIHLINMLLKKVPIIGDLLVGNEGEGLFAFEFEMRGDASDPDVISNPLSIAKPQILERASEYLGAID